MKREHLADLAVFLTVVQAKGFTQAAAQLGTSQSAVSLAVRRLEEALGIRLLNRTTRKVAPTLAGERLAQGLSPAFTEIDAQVDAQREETAAKLGFSAYGITQGDDPVAQAMKSLIDHAAAQEHQITMLWQAIETLSARQRNDAPSAACVPAGERIGAGVPYPPNPFSSGLRSPVSTFTAV